MAFSLSGYLVTVDPINIGGYNCGGWPSVFYLFGVLGMMWFPFWTFMAYETPEEHPTITKEELDLLNYGKYFPYTSQILKYF